jgi:aryl-alcohol dehydrogenase-like predicted oxidoreductase
VRGSEKNGLLATCEELGIGFVPWGPIGMGYLTQKLNADTSFNPKSDLRAGFDRITQLAQKKKATTAQLSLAWLLAQRYMRSLTTCRSEGHS